MPVSCFRLLVRRHERLCKQTLRTKAGFSEIFASKLETQCFKTAALVSVGVAITALPDPVPAAAGRMLASSKEIHSSKLTWKWRGAPYKTTILYIEPSSSFHFLLIQGGKLPGTPQLRSPPQMNQCLPKGSNVVPFWVVYYNSYKQTIVHNQKRNYNRASESGRA